MLICFLSVKGELCVYDYVCLFVHQPFSHTVIMVLCQDNITYKSRLNTLENGSFRNIDNLNYEKTVDSVLLSLFVITTGNCNITPLGNSGSNILLSVRTQYP